MVTFPIEYSEVSQLYRQTIDQNLSLISVTSTEGKEGTTMICKTLAERTAVSGQKTLLVDLNIAHPCLHLNYGLCPKDWYPSQPDKLPIQKTGIHNLSLLTFPKKSANRWEFRDQETLLSFVNQLREDFDVVIIDTSPLGRRNQGNIPPETICACTDGTLLCVLTGITNESKIYDSYDLLKSVNANLHGAILNDQYSPSLVSELIRETKRFERYFPRLIRKFRQLINNSTLLNQDI